MTDDDVVAGPIAWSPQGVAVRTHLPVSQVYRAIKTGDLAHVRIGKHIRISDSALRNWIGQDTETPASA